MKSENSETNAQEHGVLRAKVERDFRYDSYSNSNVYTWTVSVPRLVGGPAVFVHRKAISVGAGIPLEFAERDAQLELAEYIIKDIFGDRAL